MGANLSFELHKEGKHRRNNFQDHTPTMEEELQALEVCYAVVLTHTPFRPYSQNTVHREDPL